MNIPNKITLTRVCLIPIFIFLAMISYMPDSTLYFSGGKWICLAVFVIASLSDWLDGYLARKWNLVTNFGKLMDPLADKLLVCSALICLSALGRLHVIVTIVIVAREFVISGFRQVAVEKGVVIAASWWGKIKTTIQMVLVIVLLADMAQIKPAADILSWLALLFTLISMIDYLIKNKSVLKD